MTTESIIKRVIDVIMDKSPVRKRAKYDFAVQRDGESDHWSLNQSDLILDDIIDFGVGRLDSESDSTTEDERQWDESNQNSLDVSCNPGNLAKEERDRQIAILEATLSRETLQKISLGEWDDFLIKKPNKDLTSKTNHFETLSDEMVLHTFRWLPKKSLGYVALVCRRWHRLAQDESLWIRLDMSNRNLERGAVGHILSRQVVILRLTQSEIAYPPILPGVRAHNDNFKARLLYLDLSMAYASPQCLTVLFNTCQRLKKLSLEHVSVDEQVLAALSSNKDLEVLNLAMAEGLTVGGVSYLLNHCRKLKELNVAWTYLSNSCLIYLCSHLPSSLDRLNLSGCRKLLTDDSVLDLVSNCPNLRELDLSDCTGLTGSSVYHIALLEELNFLALSRCYLIPYKSLLFLKKMTSLVYLDVHGGYIDPNELRTVQEGLGSRVHINKFKFSSVARPTVGPRRSSIWGLRVRD